MNRVSFKTLGCRLNQYETDALVSEFHSGGYEVVGFDDEADIYIINTCTVTNQSDQKSRNFINQAVHKNAVTETFQSEVQILKITSNDLYNRLQN